jgi:hypothetical protein
MLKPPVAPCALIFARCRGSQSIQIDVRSACSPSNIHHEVNDAEVLQIQGQEEEDDVDQQRAVTLDALQKPDHPPHPRRSHGYGHGSEGLLFQSPCVQNLKKGKTWE